MKVVHGSCNRCGMCGCYAGPLQDNRWAPGLPTGLFDWGRRHPEQEESLITLIKVAVDWKRGDVDYPVTIRIVGGGLPIDVTLYVNSDGIQKSVDDKSCPFFELGTPNECILWGRAQLPSICTNCPQDMGDRWNELHADAWMANHPHTGQGGTCGYYWTDE